MTISPDSEAFFPGRTIAVTGAASGIGAATCTLLRRHGARVVGLDRLGTSSADRHVQVDLTDAASIDAAVASLDERVDGLINSAGVPPTAPSAVALTVNFLGTRRLTARLLDRMPDGAAVVSVASVGGRQWREHPDAIAACLETANLEDAGALCTAHRIEDPLGYALSKECIIVWTMLEAQRHRARSIRFNCVSPGPVDTPLWAVAITANLERGRTFLANSPRLGKPEEIAEVAAFLLAPASRWVNGANIPVDGGLEASMCLSALGTRISDSHTRHGS